MCWQLLLADPEHVPKHKPPQSASQAQDMTVCGMVLSLERMLAGTANSAGVLETPDSQVTW